MAACYPGLRALVSSSTQSPQQQCAYITQDSYHTRCERVVAPGTKWCKAHRNELTPQPDDSNDDDEEVDAMTTEDDESYLRTKRVLVNYILAFDEVTIRDTSGLLGATGWHVDDWFHWLITKPHLDLLRMKGHLDLQISSQSKEAIKRITTLRNELTPHPDSEVDVKDENKDYCTQCGRSLGFKIAGTTISCCKQVGTVCRSGNK